MNQDQTFRLVLIVGAVIVLPVMVYHRLRSQATGERLDRWQEGLFILFTLRPIGVATMVGLILYMINPGWMAWSSVSLPEWSRWAGAGLGVIAGGLLFWTLRNLGKNLTDTVVTRRVHTLVFSGPYRWVRHPFYDAVALCMLANGLAAANWFILLGGGVTVALLVVRTRTEEEKLLLRFGESYRTYVERTGRFLPKIRHRVVILAAVLVAVLSSPVRLRSQTTPSELGWVGLFNATLVDWLENENRLEELCNSFKELPGRWGECRVEKMQPKVAVMTVRTLPRDSAARRGAIVVVATPGRGLTAHASSGGVATAFEPDLFDGDWGYGPYFHQTIVNRQGSWYQVPIDALPGPAWLNAVEWSGAADVQDVDGIISTPQGDMVVLGIADRELRVRPEQPADMWCESGEPPPLKPWKEIRIPFRELFNPTGHLLITRKYTRGC